MTSRSRSTCSNISVLTTYIFQLTNWSPPLYSTAAAVAIILMVVTGALVLVQQRVLAGKCLRLRCFPSGL